MSEHTIDSLMDLFHDFNGSQLTVESDANLVEALLEKGYTFDPNGEWFDRYGYLVNPQKSKNLYEIFAGLRSRGDIGPFLVVVDDKVNGTKGIFPVDFSNPFKIYKKFCTAAVSVIFNNEPKVSFLLATNSVMVDDDGTFCLNQRPYIRYELLSIKRSLSPDKND